MKITGLSGHIVLISLIFINDIAITIDMDSTVDITAIYENPLLEDSSFALNLEQDASVRLALDECSSTIEQIVDEKRKKLGINDIRPIELPDDKAAKLRTEIKIDPYWLESFEKILNLAQAKTRYKSITELVSHVYLPWWNSLLLYQTGEQYSPERPSMIIDGVMSHSYITQLIRQDVLGDGKGKAMSVSNVLLTAEGSIVLGWRLGHSFPNTIMTVPAGSVEYHPGNNPLFDTLYEEFDEELGLKKKQIVEPMLIGKIDNGMIAGHPHYVFRSRVDMTYTELVKYWKRKRPRDMREHSSLLKFHDDPDYVLDKVRMMGFKPEAADDRNISRTTAGNLGAILPQCAASLLVHFAQRYNANWQRYAEEKTYERYRFLAASTT